MNKNKTKKILILRLGAIGDVVLTTVIAKAIKDSHPDYIIHYLTQSEISPILANNPYIDKIIEWDRSSRKSLKYTLNIIKILFKEHYDVIFNLTNSIRNLFLSFLAVPKKIVFKKNSNCSWVENYFQTAKSAFNDLEIPKELFLGVKKDDLEKVTEYIEQYKPPYIMIIPGGGTDKNRQGRIWDIENWKTLSKELINKYNGTVFVIGSLKEQDTHLQLSDKKVIILSGKYTLSESSAILSKSNLVISGDTGTMHIASAHSVPVIGLLGSTSPDKIKAYGNKGFYVSAENGCRYCWKKKCKYLKTGEKYTPCMQNITPKMVLDKIEKEKLL